MSHQFKWPIEGLALPEAFVLQRALWHRESSDSIARLLNVEVTHVQHAQALVEHDRKRVHLAPVETLFPWNQEPGFLQNARAIGLYKRQIEYLRRNPGKILSILKLPPALSPQGWQLEHARVLLEFLHEQAFDAPWMVTIRAAPGSLLDEVSEVISVVKNALRKVDRIEIVAAPRIQPDDRAIRVALSRSDMAGAPGLGDAIQATVLIAILHYRLISHEHALYAAAEHQTGVKGAATLK